MSILSIHNVSIRGVAACVPQRTENNADYPHLDRETLNKYIETVGVVHRHCAHHDGSICTSDLCHASADRLLEVLGWNREDVGLLFFVSHTADYKLPSTACILQDRLNLSKECMAFDSPLGCSGFVYGLSVAASIMQTGNVKRALLLVGNTQSFYASPLDKSTALLFGDAGSAMALEYDEQAVPMRFHLQSDGSGAEVLMVPDGGCRHPFNQDSLQMEYFDDGIGRTRLHEKMDGGAVFTFALFNVPKSLKKLMTKFEVDANAVDYLLLHQANKFLCESIRKKLKFPSEKTPYNIQEYGNTSGATIPLLMVTNLANELQAGKLRLLMSGFGVGLSLGSAFIETDKIIVPELIQL